MQYEPIEILSNIEIDDIINSEMNRLGEYVEYFEISWMQNEKVYQLSLMAVTNLPSCEKSGRCYPLGSAPLEDSCGNNLDSLDRVIATGRQLYYRLRKSYPTLKFKRDLSRT